MTQEEIKQTASELADRVIFTTKEVLTSDETARYMGISKSYLYKLTMRREIPHYKPMGKVCYFNRKEIEYFLQRNKVDCNQKFTTCETEEDTRISTRGIEILDEETTLKRAWISLNPHEDSTEYTDLSQVWHDTSDIPSLNKEIVGLMDNGAIMVISRSRIRDLSMMNDRKKIRNWATYTCFYKIVRWAYVEDLLPKGGKI